MLDGTRDLRTGRLVQAPGRERLGVLPPRTGLKPTEEELARQEYLDTWCDADGHEFLPSPEPSRGEYGGHEEQYEAARTAWERAERHRIAHAESAKQATWDEGLPERRRALRDVEAAMRPGGSAGGLARRAIEAARAAFDWMRERVAAARGTLGRGSPVTTSLETQWLDTLADHTDAHDAVRADHENQARALQGEASEARVDTDGLWQEVERRREAERARQAAWSAYRGLSGPGR